jgi:hypothetical protein
MNQEVFLSVQQEGADQKFRLAVFGCEFDRISGKMRSGTPYLVTSFDRVSPEMLDKGARRSAIVKWLVTDMTSSLV